MDDREPAIRASDALSRESSTVRSGTSGPAEAEAPGTPAHRRRAQRRQATYDEMMGRARSALDEGRPLSLRAIAAEMGLTASALYRYVDSHAALQAALADTVWADLLEALEEAARAESDVGAGLVAAMVAFRQWALDRPHEFRLLCSAHDETHLDSGVDEADLEATWAMRLAIRFMPRVETLYRAGEITAPSEDELPPGAAEAIRSSLPRWFPDGDVPDVPVGLWWAGVRHWVVLCGTVAAEVHRLVGPPFREGALLREALRSTCAQLGVPDSDQTVPRVLDQRLPRRRTA